MILSREGLIGWVVFEGRLVRGCMVGFQIDFNIGC